MSRYVAAALGLALLGCQRTILEGTVTDRAGSPIAGASVAVVNVLGQLCGGETDDAGRFSFSCKSITHDLVIARQGYVTEQLFIEALDKRSYPLGTITLLPIPATAGLYALQGAYWEAPVKAWLERKDSESGPGHSTCLVEPPNGTRVPSKALLYAHELDGIEVFRVDDQGCVPYIERRGAHWSDFVPDGVMQTKRHVAGSPSPIYLELEPGRYAVASWKDGDFQEDPAATREAGGKRFPIWLLFVADP